MLKTIVFCLLLSVVIGSSVLSNDDLALTIYSNNFAMVKDIRTISFEKG